MTSADGPGSVASGHCLICASVTTRHADGTLARALTVRASRLYAELCDASPETDRLRRTGRG